MTYDQALSLFRNMVNQKHPPQMGAAHIRACCNINELSTGHGDRGGQFSGRSGRGGRHKGGLGTQRTRTDSRIITLTDGQKVEYHASFNFPKHIYMKMKEEDREIMRRERQQYND